MEDVREKKAQREKTQEALRKKHEADSDDGADMQSGRTPMHEGEHNAASMSNNSPVKEGDHRYSPPLTSSDAMSEVSVESPLSAGTAGSRGTQGQKNRMNKVGIASSEQVGGSSSSSSNYRYTASSSSDDVEIKVDDEIDEQQIKIAIEGSHR